MTSPPVNVATSQRRLAAWQAATLGILLVGYSGYYVCRSNLSVATPLILKEYEGRGIDKSAIGLIVSTGLTVYAVGKFASGVASGYLAGRSMFLAGMGGAVVCTLLFSWSTALAAFVAIWSVNRLFQTMGWPALLKISARWFPVTGQGLALGMISLSYLFGDAFSRWYLGKFIRYVDWRTMFQFAAVSLAVVAAVSALFLRESPADVGAQEPAANPYTLLGDAETGGRALGVAAILGLLARDASFWLICLMSFGMTLIRETLTFWTPAYLHEVMGVAADRAAVGSMFFPLVGGISAVSMGYLSDSLGIARRNLVMAPTMLLATAAIGTLGLMGSDWGYATALGVLSLVAFLLIGPYSLLGGVMALDLGGKQGGSTAGGIIDGAGYLGAILSGYGIGALAEYWGWGAAMAALALASAMTTIVAGAFWLLAARRTRRAAGQAARIAPGP